MAALRLRLKAPLTTWRPRPTTATSALSQSASSQSALCFSGHFDYLELGYDIHPENIIALKRVKTLPTCRAILVVGTHHGDKCAFSKCVFSKCA